MPYDQPSLPEDRSAELSVVGGVLYVCTDRGNNHFFDEIAETVGVADFYSGKLADIWASMAVLSEKGISISALTILEHIRSTGTWVHKEKPNEALAYALECAPSSMEIRDYAGLVARVAARRRLAIAGQEISSLAEQPGHDKGVSTIYSQARDLLDGAEDARRKTGDWISAADAVTAELDELDEHLKLGRPRGLSTGISKLDDKIGGLHRGDLMVIGGASSMGKTALALNICMGAARTEEAKVALFSQEMTKQQLAWRAAAQEARRIGAGKVEYQSLRNGQMDQTDIATLRAGLASMPTTLAWNMTRGLTFQDVRSALRKAKRKLGSIDVVCLDYLQIMQIASSREKTRAQAIGEVTMGLKKLAGDENCAMIVLSQLSRLKGRDDKRPTLDDLRESGAIEQDADCVLFAYREEYYLERSQPDWNKTAAWQEWNVEMEAARGRMDVIVGKQRMGPIGTVNLHFEKETDLIVDDEKFLDDGGMF
ncbi:MAG: DnaB-like helicase C-terminal domain-containing protein [Pseudomonadota bacterium]